MHYLVKQEATNLVVPFAICPDKEKITAKRDEEHMSRLRSYLRNRRVRDPGLTSINDKLTIDFFGGSFHSSGVRPMIRFRKPLYDCQKCSQTDMRSLQKHQLFALWLNEREY